MYWNCTGENGRGVTCIRQFFCWVFEVIYKSFFIVSEFGIFTGHPQVCQRVDNQIIFLETQMSEHFWGLSFSHFSKLNSRTRFKKVRDCVKLPQDQYTSKYSEAKADHYYFRGCWQFCSGDGQERTFPFIKKNMWNLL